MNNSPDIKFFIGGKEVKNIDLGVVPAGTTKRFNVQVSNKGVFLEDVKITIDNAEVRVITHPHKIGDGTLIIEYSPKKDVTKGARATISVEGQYVV